MRSYNTAAKATRITKAVLITPICKIAATQQSYGKIIQKKVGDEMSRLNEEL